MTRLISCLLLLVSTVMLAADPAAPVYSWDQCRGSARPYPAPEQVAAYPDSLTPVLINHVGRHGARFASSSKVTDRLLDALNQAQKSSMLTAKGQQFKQLVEYVRNRTAGRWGALDSLGMAEQRGIASRLARRFPMLVNAGSVTAISSYAPRCIMSMYEFTHQLARLDNSVSIITSSGRQYSPLLRFFEDNPDYTQFLASDALTQALATFTNEQPVVTTAIERIIGKDFADRASLRTLAMDQFKFLAGLAAAGFRVNIADYMTPEEYNAMWRIDNFNQYVRRTATTVSAVPAEIASPLLTDIISTFSEYIAEPRESATIVLRFAHAETLMPLLSLMHLPGCYYLTNYYDTVDRHWCNFDVVPMASNLQMILLRSTSGRYYVRTDLNEKPVTLIPGSDDIYVEWRRARTYLEQCIPLYY